MFDFLLYEKGETFSGLKYLTRIFKHAYLNLFINTNLWIRSPRLLLIKSIAEILKYALDF